MSGSEQSPAVSAHAYEITHDVEREREGGREGGREREREREWERERESISCFCVYSGGSKIPAWHCNLAKNILVCICLFASACWSLVIYADADCTLSEFCVLVAKLLEQTEDQSFAHILAFSYNLNLNQMSIIICNGGSSKCRPSMSFPLGLPTSRLH